MITKMNSSIFIIMDWIIFSLNIILILVLVLMQAVTRIALFCIRVVEIGITRVITIIIEFPVWWSI